MPEEKNILSLMFNLTIQEVETTDETGSTVTEELYSIKCGDSVCWELTTEKGGGERERSFVRLQIEHVINHLRAGLERRANRIGEESYFAAAKQMPHVPSGGWKEKGIEFFEQRVQSYQDRARKILSIRRGRPQKLTNAQMGNWILRWARLKAVVSLPQATFSPYGAGVKTSIVFLQKRSQPLSQEELLRVEEDVVIADENYNVFMSQINNIGYDAAGRMLVPENDAHEPPDVRNTIADFSRLLGW